MADGKSEIHKYLGTTRLLMKNYQPPKNIANMPQHDTLAVICLLLCFIEKEPSISKTKLAYQMMLLDNMLILKGGQVRLMDLEC